MNHPRYHNVSKADDLPIAYGTGTLWFQGPDNDGVRTEAVAAIQAAIDLGYRHLDGAQMYNTEHELGAALAGCGVPRAALFVTTKTTALDDVEAALEQSLARLQTGYVDLYLLHHPFGARSPAHLRAAWRAMGRCRERGLARAIGVSSFGVRHLEILATDDNAAADAAGVPSVLQMELHPYVPRPAALLAYLRAKGIAVEGFAALTPLTTTTAAAEPGQPAPPLLAVVDALAARYHTTPAAVLLRFVLDQGAVAITTSSKASRLAAYRADVAGFRLTAADIEALWAAGAHTPHRSYFADEFAAEEAAAAAAAAGNAP